MWNYKSEHRMKNEGRIAMFQSMICLNEQFIAHMALCEKSALLW